MEEKKYLTEENYEKGKRKLKLISLVILIVGILVGGGLILTGIIKTNSAKKQNEISAQQTEESNKTRTATEVQADIDKLENQIDEIDTQITNLENEKTKLTNERTKIFQEDFGFSDRYYAKDDEITLKENEIQSKYKEKSKLESSIMELESELWKITSGYNDAELYIGNVKNTVSTAKYFPFYMFGAFIIIASCMISGVVYFISKRREITAFTTQQVMPIAKEGINEIAPTMGNVAGEIAKGITSGIKEGLNDDAKK